VSKLSSGVKYRSPAATWQDFFYIKIIVARLKIVASIETLYWQGFWPPLFWVTVWTQVPLGTRITWIGRICTDFYSAKQHLSVKIASDERFCRVSIIKTVVAFINKKI
jgi:hypothetical protein